MIDKAIDFATKAGLPGKIVEVDMGYSGRWHRCGYVGISNDSLLYGIEYGDQIDLLTADDVDNAEIGKKSPILAITACVRSDGDGQVRRSLDVAIDVHGGLTFSGKMGGSDLWWFGFDTAHHGDNDFGGQSEEYVKEEIERLAKQISALMEKAK
jgi:hypothetical protein